MYGNESNGGCSGAEKTVDGGCCVGTCRARRTVAAGWKLTVVLALCLMIWMLWTGSSAWFVDTSFAAANTPAPAEAVPAEAAPATPTAKVKSSAETKAFNAVDLPDGDYEADSFSWSGGSGRLEYIKCEQITVKDGGAYAELVFASKYYDHLRIMEQTFKRSSVDGETSHFQVPVKLNANMEIEGRTTAMSQPHWIPYEIYVGKKGADANGDAMIDTGTLEDQNRKMKTRLLEEAPIIIGLEGGTRVQTENAQFLRIFRYEGGALIQVKSDAEGALGAGLYGQKVVNYLVVPEDVEVPAGTEKQYVIIPQRPNPVYVDSTFAAATLKALGITCNTADDREFDAAAMVRAGTKLCVLGRNKTTGDIEKQMSLLKMPLFIDRSEEESAGAQATWTLAYGEIFGERDAAEMFLAAADEQAAREAQRQRRAAVILLMGIVCAMLILPVIAKRG